MQIAFEQRQHELWEHRVAALQLFVQIVDSYSSGFIEQSPSTGAGAAGAGPGNEAVDQEFVLEEIVSDLESKASTTKSRGTEPGSSASECKVEQPNGAQDNDDSRMQIAAPWVHNVSGAALVAVERNRQSERAQQAQSEQLAAAKAAAHDGA